MRLWLLVLAGIFPLLADPNRARIADALGNLPITFEENRGQTASEVKFISRAGRFSLFLTEKDAVLALPSTGNTIRMRLEGARKPAAIQGLDRRIGTSNYFIGNDSKKWRSAVPHFGRVLYREIYSGVDVVYRGNNKQLEYDFILQAGADANQIVLGFQGVEGLRLDNNGDLVLRSADGELRERRPIAYQETAGGRRNVEVEYRILAAGRAGFRLGDYDHARPLIIDPVLSYSTYLGLSGSSSVFGFDTVTGFAVDAAGNAYLTGTTYSPDFPATADANASGNVNFVAKLSPDGTQLLYSTFLGAPRGSAGAAAIAVDPSGNAYITGACSSGFPVTPGAYSTDPNKGGSFAAKLNGTGDRLLYSTFLNSAGGANPQAIAVDGSSTAYITGDTQDSSFPTTPGAFQASFQVNTSGQGTHAFVMALNSSGSGVVYSTFLGGNGADAGRAIAVDAAGSAYVAGVTDNDHAPNTFPVTQGVVQPAANGLGDAFAAKLNNTGTALIFSTYLGGSSYDAATSIAVDLQGNVVVGGGTSSTDFPVTSGAYQSASQRGGGFVTKLSADGTSRMASTYLAGSDAGCATSVSGVALDSGGDVYVAGNTTCSTFPLTADAFQPAGARLGPNQWGDAFLTELDPAFSSVLFATFLGPAVKDKATGIALDSFGNVYIAGSTASPNFLTTPGVLAPELAGRQNVFVVKINPFAAGTCTYSLAPGGRQSFDSRGGMGSFGVLSQAGCPWVVIPSLPQGFVESVSGARGSGNGAYNFHIPANHAKAERTSTLTVQGQTFTITQSGVTQNGTGPALSVALSHVGNFAAGQQNATYTVTVSNAANADPTSGTVTATETVPSGLILVSMSGSGWDCPSNGNTCTRGDALNQGSSYAPITVTVNVAANATSPQVNAVSVAGGGAAAANATDTTIIGSTASGGQEIGVVDAAGDVNGFATVIQSGTLYVRGWAADTANGAPVQTVIVFVDGNIVGLAALGGVRPDVAQAYNRSDFSNSGWNFQMSAGTLSLGPHSVTATAMGSSGTGQLLGSKMVTISTMPPVGQEIGFVDAAGDVNGVATVIMGGTLYVRGWAADTVSGAPVQSVTVFVDGNSVGTATLGIARPDVAQFYIRGDFTSSGWTFQMSSGALSVGPHSVTATAVGSSGTGQLLGSKTVTISVPSGGGQEIGFVELAGDVNGVGTVIQGGTLYVSGWAADTVSGAPVQSVTVFVDGSSVGTATLGIARPDVAQFFNRSDFTSSGWTFQMPAGTLSVGPHMVTATAAGSSGTGQLFGGKTVTIIVPSGGQEIGVVDAAGDVNGGATLTQGGTLYVRGWAADTVGGAPVQSVTIFVDGNSVGTATLGIARPDVAQFYNRSDFTNSGWTLQISTGALSLGPHMVTATAAGSSGTGQLLGSKTITITMPSGGGQVIGFVDAAGDVNGVATVAQGQTLSVVGWAADTVNGAPVLSVAVFVDGNLVGLAVEGGTRTDVAQFYNRSDFTHSGWTFQMSTGMLSVGTHQVTATATGTSGAGPLMGSKTVAITP